MKVWVFGDKKWNKTKLNEKANENDMGSDLDVENLQSCRFLIGNFLCYIQIQTTTRKNKQPSQR